MSVTTAETGLIEDVIESLTAPPQDADRASVSDDPFQLNIRIIEHAPASDKLMMCATDDGCGSTCGSACTS